MKTICSARLPLVGHIQVTTCGAKSTACACVRLFAHTLAADGCRRPRCCVCPLPHSAPGAMRPREVQALNTCRGVRPTRSSIRMTPLWLTSSCQAASSSKLLNSRISSSRQPLPSGIHCSSFQPGQTSARCWARVSHVCCFFAPQSQQGTQHAAQCYTLPFSTLLPGLLIK